MSDDKPFYKEVKAINKSKLLIFAMMLALSLTGIAYGVPIEGVVVARHPPMPEKIDVLEYLESTTDDFPEQVKYDDGEYEGVLEKKGESYLSDKSTTKVETRYISNHPSQQYNADGFTGTLNRYVSGGSLVPAERKQVTASILIEADKVTGYDNVAPTYSYEKEGYSGLLQKSNYDILAQGDMVVYYKGEVLKPAVDTRTFLYQGTVSREVADEAIYRQDYEGMATLKPLTASPEGDVGVVDPEVANGSEEVVSSPVESPGNVDVDHGDYPMLVPGEQGLEPANLDFERFSVTVVEGGSTLANLFNFIASYAVNFANNLDMMMVVSVGIGFVVSLIFLVLLTEIFKRRTKFRYLNNMEGDLNRFKRKLKRKVDNQKKLAISEKERNVVVGIAILMATATNNLTSMPQFVAIGIFIGLGIVLIFQKNRKNKIHTQKIKEISILFEAIELYMRAGYSMYQALRTSRLLVTHIRPSIDMCLSYWGAGPKTALAKFQEELNVPEAETLILMLVNLESSGSKEMQKAIGGEVFNIESIQKMKVNASISNKPLVMMVYRMLPMASVLGITVGSMLYRTFAMLSASGLGIF